MKVFKKSDNKQYPLVQKLTKEESDSNQFKRLGSQLALAAKIFGGELILPALAKPTTPKDMDEQLKMALGLYEGRQCKACHVFENPFEEQKPTFMLFGDDSTFSSKTLVVTTEKRNHLFFRKSFLGQSQSAITQLASKKCENNSIFGIIVSTPKWLIELTKIHFRSLFKHFQSTVKQEEFLFLQRW